MQAFVVQLLLPVVFIGGNLWFWHGVVTRWQGALRERVARRFGVEIEIGGRGHWRVVAASTPRPWWQRLGIELLQLGFFIGAALLWGVVMVGAVVLMKHLGAQMSAPP